ncbi:MAG: TetR/AcrR family transcriptional regulator [Acidimicrobiia bacterium]
MPETGTRTSDAEHPTGLSEQAIVAAAVEILGERGVAGLTMRELSTHLGVALGATYNHVRSKHELLKLVAEELYGRIQPGPPDADGFARARAVMLDIHRLLGTYPGMAAYMGQHLTEFGSPRVAELVVTPLREAGLGAADAERVTLALVLVTAGHLLLRAPGGEEDEVEPDRAAGSFVEVVDLLLDGARARIRADRPGPPGRGRAGPR